MTGTAEDADPLALAVAFAQLYLEVESGRRPRATLAPLMTPWLAARLAPYWVRGGPMRHPGAARGTRLGPDNFEATVIARGRDRSGVVALRLERQAGGWRVTDASRPEDGPLPQPAVFLPSLEPCAFDLICPGLHEDGSHEDGHGRDQDWGHDSGQVAGVERKELAGVGL